MECKTEGFQFQYVRSGDLEKVVMKVQNDRKMKDSIWDNFRSMGSGGDRNEFENVQENGSQSGFQPLSGDEIASILNSNENGRSSASLFGPSRKMNVVTKKSEPIAEPPDSPRSSHSALSVHIDEELDDDQQTICAAVEKFKSEVEIQTDEIREYSPNDSPGTSREISKKSSGIDQQENIIYYNESDSKFFDDFPREKSMFTLQEEQRISELLKKAEDECSYIDENFKFLLEYENQEEEEENENSPFIYPKIEIHSKASEKELNEWEEKELDDEFKPKDRKPGKQVRINLDNIQRRSYEDLSNPVKAEEEVKRISDRIQQGVSLQDEMMSVLERITSFQKKTCDSLDELRHSVQIEPFIEDENDMKKRKKRSAEFTNRFARNYLYQIGRIAEEIRHQSKPETDLSSKVYTLYQIIMQATQTYQKNIEYLIFTQYPEKLEVLVDFIINATKICLEKNVFDRRDAIIQKMLRKCLKLKDQLVANLETMTPLPLPKVKKEKSLTKMTSKTDLLPGSLTMYGNPQKVASNHVLRGYRSPYSSQMLLKPNSSKQMLSKKHHKLTPKNSKTKQHDEAGTKNKKNPLNMELIAETVHNLAEEKISEILLPLVTSLSKKNTSSDSDKSSSDEPQIEVNVPRVTASKEAKKVPVKVEEEESFEDSEENVEKMEPKSSVEKVQTVAKNVQYTMIKSNDDSSDASNKKSETKKSATHKKKPKIAAKTLVQAQLEEAKKIALKERNEFIEALTENPLYVHECFPQPWRMLSNISDQLLVDAIEEVCREIDFGEVEFLQEFLGQELIN